MSQDRNLSSTIANMEALLNSGIVQTSQDGTTTTFDLDRVAQSLRDLKKLDPCAQVNGTARPVMFKANFSRMSN